MENIRIPLRELIDTAKERLQELQYAPATINAFSRYWRELLEYAEKVQTHFVLRDLLQGLYQVSLKKCAYPDMYITRLDIICGKLLATLNRRTLK